LWFFFSLQIAVLIGAAMKVTKLDIFGAAVLGAIIGSMFALFI
jgi:hypothetical protein